MSSTSPVLEQAKRYFAALESGVSGDALAPFFAPNVVQEEFPNRLAPNGVRRNLGAILEASLRGQKVMAKQRYEILHAVASGNHIALEVSWTGTLKIAFGPLPAGSEMRARLAVFLEFRDGKIAALRNYDCFEPW